MKYLKKYKLFENLESKIDLNELEEVLIDFKQMGLDWDAKVGSSMVINWERVNTRAKGTIRKEIDGHFISSKVSLSEINTVLGNELDRFSSSKTDDSLTIEFSTDKPILREQPHQYNFDDVVEGYEMIKDYLFENYGLIPNYIYINYHWNYLYFENFERIKEHKKLYPEGHNGIKLGTPSDTNDFKAHKLIFGFYKQI
jgi:hypothetical protein